MYKNIPQHGVFFFSICKRQACCGVSKEKWTINSFCAWGVLRTSACMYVPLCVTDTIIDQVFLLGEVSIKLLICLNRARRGVGGGGVERTQTQLEPAWKQWQRRGLGGVHHWRLKALHCAYLCSTVENANSGCWYVQTRGHTGVQQSASLLITF